MDRTKPADTDAPLLEPIRMRWSPRTFDPRPISESDLRTILSAAQWAASSYNEQPWRYLLARRSQPDEFASLLGCLTERNQLWARSAAVLLLSFSRPTFSHNGKPNRVWIHDVGLASAQMVVQAMALGIYAHQMVGIDPDRIKQTFKIPPPFEPVTAMALGYMGRLEDLDETFRESEVEPRTRRPLGETFFTAQWDAPYNDP